MVKYFTSHQEHEAVKGHKQTYAVDFGHEPDDFWVQWVVKARSPLKAERAALRLQKAGGWPFMRFDPQPLKSYKE